MVAVDDILHLSSFSWKILQDSSSKMSTSWLSDNMHEI